MRLVQRRMKYSRAPAHRLNCLSHHHVPTSCPPLLNCPVFSGANKLGRATAAHRAPHGPHAIPIIGSVLRAHTAIAEHASFQPLHETSGRRKRHTNSPGRLRAEDAERGQVCGGDRNRMNLMIGLDHTSISASTATTATISAWRSIGCASPGSSWCTPANGRHAVRTVGFDVDSHGPPPFVMEQKPFYRILSQRTSNGILVVCVCNKPRELIRVRRPILYKIE